MIRQLIGIGLVKIGEKMIGELKKIDKKTIEEMFMPEEYKENFEAGELREKAKEWNLEIKERKNMIPKEIRGKTTVLNGYKDKIEIMDHPFKGKAMYLHIYRRKWKEKGKRKSYSNEYKLHPEGMKITHRLMDFLKGLARQERIEFYNSIEGIRDFNKNSIQMV